MRSGETPAGLAPVPSSVRLDQLFECCPVCKHPYTMNFIGYEYVLVGQVVCGGSPVLKLCLPTVYLCFQAPLSSMHVEVEQDGQKYRGVVYAYRSEETDDDR